ncbi:MAG: helix-turn-helix transcriptional regulator [Oscillospiraceae bacterium]|nr:helix-turn-helix transcriptional regulator [Oscillospiraceae bacterium]
MFNRITKYRKKAGLSQAKIAELLGVAQNTVSYWERGINTPSYETLEKLAVIFNCEADNLLQPGKFHPVSDTPIKKREPDRDTEEVYRTLDKINHATGFMSKDEVFRLYDIAKSAFPDAFINSERVRNIVDNAKRNRP